MVIGSYATSQRSRAGRRCARGAFVARVITAGIAACSVAIVPAAQGQKRVPRADENQLLDQPQRIPALVARGALRAEQVPNPHWRRDACGACHAAPATRAASNLRDADVNRLCNTCHDAVWPHSYIHPVGMKPDKDMRRRMPEPFRRSLERADGALTCATCHDVPMQCLPERAGERALNPRFFRGGPYKARTDLCYRCHDAEQYRRLNPHDQVAGDGAIREHLCLVCHVDNRGLKQARSGAGLRFVADDRAALCTGCHKSIPHPGGFSFSGRKDPSHLVAPSPAIARRMQQAERTHGVSLPLDPGSGKLHCATCHNPHARGVVARPAAAMGADSKDRLRAPELCVMCHEK